MSDELSDKCMMVVVWIAVGFFIGYTTHAVHMSYKYDLTYFEEQLRNYGGEGVDVGTANYHVIINENTTLGELKRLYFFEGMENTQYYAWGRPVAQAMFKQEIKKICTGVKDAR